MTSLSQLFTHRIIPVVVLTQSCDADPVAEALISGGLPIAEVTLRTPASAEAIRKMAGRGDIIVGAGTVVTADQVDAVADAGAQFVVSPGLSEAVVRRCQERDLPCLPGAVTPSEVIAALDLGVHVCKFFPANTFGGPAAIKALGAPFGGVQFVPTGGVSASNLADYLALPNVAAVGGSWMVAADLVSAGDFDEITRLTREAVAAAGSPERTP